MKFSEFRNLLNRLLQDELTQIGFSKIDRGTFVRKTDAHEIYVIWIQKHSSESKVCVNLGVHYDFIPKAGTSEAIERNTIAQSDCEIKKRLTPDPSQNDYWWPLGSAEAEEIASLITETALPFFDQYALNGDLARIVPKQFSGDLPCLLSSLTRVRACLLMARIYEEKGNLARAAEFARLGVTAAGMAVGPKKTLKEILKRTQQ